MSLSPPPSNIVVKNQEVNCESEILIVSALQSVSVNNVCKLLQLLEDFVPQTPYPSSAPRTPPYWGNGTAGIRGTCFGVRVPRTLDYPTKNINPC